MRQALSLVLRGVSEDTAFALDDVERIAWNVAVGELEGGEFDWDEMKWRERD